MAGTLHLLRRIRDSCRVFPPSHCLIYSFSQKHNSTRSAWGEDVTCFCSQLTESNINLHDTQLRKSSNLKTFPSNPEHPQFPNATSRCRRSSPSKRLPPSDTLRVEIRSFSQTDSSLAGPWSIIVVGCGVVHRAVVPDCQVV